MKRQNPKANGMKPPTRPMKVLVLISLVHASWREVLNGILEFSATRSDWDRSLPGPLPDELVRMSRAGVSREEIYKAQNAYVGMRDGMLFGDLSKGYASFGLGITLIRAVEPVRAVMDRLAGWMDA